METKTITVRRYQAKYQDQVWNLHTAALLDVGAHLGNGARDEDLKEIERQYLENSGDFLVGLIGDNVIVMKTLRKSSECAFFLSIRDMVMVN